MFLFFFILTILFIILHIIFSKQLRTKKGIIEISLSYILAIYIGLTGIVSAMGHIFFPDDSAKMIGWVAGSPFQFEVGTANLGYGIAGILCIWFRGYFWLSTIITSGIFLFGEGIGHLYQFIVEGNHAEYNAGSVLYLDLIVPVLMLFLYILYSSNQSLEKNKDDLREKISLH